MRNLQCIRRECLDVQSKLPLDAICWDVLTDSIIYTSGPTKDNEVIELWRSRCRRTIGGTGTTSTHLIASWDAPCPIPELDFDKVICLDRLVNNDATCLVLAGGDIIIVREELLQGQEKIEIVGSVDSGISAAAWSPDQELLAVTTRVGSLLFMTADFDNVANVVFGPEDSRLSKHVSVGWGKVETQFKGKRVKAIRDPTMPEKVDEGTLSIEDQQQVSISWRGDGAFVAVNAVEAGRRMVRVYTRECALDSVSEPVDGLEGALSWKPSGNLLAGIQRVNDDLQVMFFERNGLLHGSFPLRCTSSDHPAVDLRWNVDSTVLAISFCDHVQLWTMNNYHYYLKQIIYMPESNDHPMVKAFPVRVEWHPEEPLRLALFQIVQGDASTQLQDAQFNFRVNGGPNIIPNDFGNTVVTDGCVLRVTPLKVANVPPPMALHEVILQEDAIDVSISQTNARIAVLHRNSYSIFGYSSEHDPSTQSTLKITATFPFNTDHKNETRLQICFLGEDDIFMLSKQLVSDGVSHIYDLNTWQICSLNNIAGIFPSQDHTKLYASDQTTLYEIYENGQMCLRTPFDWKFPIPVSWVEVVHLQSETVAIGLTNSGNLYANDRLLVRNCTSFLITNSHILYTTSNHLLKFIHLTNIEDLEVPADQPETDERCRSIERGARLVSVMPSVFSVVLQMPRGNLETIHPRALVLPGIRTEIDLKHYKKAFLICRIHRVDFNIIYDHAPEQFIEDIDLVIDELRKKEFIDLFLAQLSQDDVTKTMYKETNPTFSQAISTVQRSDKVFVGPLKVNLICDAFLKALKDRTSTHLGNLISAHLCKVPPDIEAGLYMIDQLSEKQPELVEKAIEQLCFLADANKIYEAALGIYNMKLALLSAQQSQKDPREYLPYLQSLQDLPQLRRQFKIDDGLGRYSKALNHLSSMDEFDEVLRYTQVHEMYGMTLEMYKYDSKRQSQVMQIYASFLNERNRFKEAGTAYEFLSDYISASEAYRAAVMWQESLSSASLAALSQEQMQHLAKDLIESLIESRDYFSAARIYLDYLSDVEAAAKNFCKGYHFAEAARVVSLHGRQDLLSSAVDPGLIEGSATLTELLADCKTQLEAQVPRLRELRQIKARDPLAFYEGEGPSADIPDDMSLAPSDTSTTGNTFFTRYTGKSGTGTINSATSRKTSKNRKREERKRARGKKGSVYEEEYLVNSIGRLIERVNSVSDEVKRTVECLLRRGMRERGRAVEEMMIEVVCQSRECLAEVFGLIDRDAERVADAEEGRMEMGDRPQGAEAVLFDSVEDGKRKKVAPVVKEFERSALLGG